MTATALLIQRAARATEEAFEFAETLEPGNVALQRAKNEPRRDDVFALPELVSALAKICQRQQLQIVELAERVEALEGRSSGEEGAAKK